MQPAELEITTGSPVEHTVVLVVRGELDISNTQQLSVAVERALADRPAELVLDLAGVSFCDSRGLAALIRAHQDAADVGATLVVAHLQDHVARLFAITGMYDVLRVR